MSDTPTTTVQLLDRIRNQRLRLADLAYYDQGMPYASLYESEPLLLQFDELASAAAEPGNVAKMLAQPQQLAVLYALAPWPVLDVILPTLETAWEEQQHSELQVHVRVHCPAEVLPMFEHRMRLIDRVSQIVRLVRWQHPAVVHRIAGGLRMKHGA